MYQYYWFHIYNADRFFEIYNNILTECTICFTKQFQVFSPSCTNDNIFFPELYSEEDLAIDAADQIDKDDAG